MTETDQPKIGQSKWWLIYAAVRASAINIQDALDILLSISNTTDSAMAQDLTKISVSLARLQIEIKEKKLK